MFTGVRGGPPGVSSTTPVGGASTLVVDPNRAAILAPFLANFPKPKFSGVDVDWVSFVKEWDYWVNLQQEAYGLAIPDGILLELLRHSLDEVSRLRLQARRESNPGVTFQQFWWELERTFQRDAADIYQKD